MFFVEDFKTSFFDEPFDSVTILFLFLRWTISIQRPLQPTWDSSTKECVRQHKSAGVLFWEQSSFHISQCSSRARRAVYLIHADIHIYIFTDKYMVHTKRIYIYAYSTMLYNLCIYIYLYLIYYISIWSTWSHMQLLCHLCCADRSISANGGGSRWWMGVWLGGVYQFEQLKNLVVWAVKIMHPIWFLVISTKYSHIFCASHYNKNIWNHLSNEKRDPGCLGYKQGCNSTYKDEITSVTHYPFNLFHCSNW